MLNPLRSEHEAFLFFVYAALTIAAVVAVVLLVRALV